MTTRETGTKLVEGLTNNKLFAGFVLLVITLAIAGFRSSAATDVRVNQVEHAQTQLEVKVEALSQVRQDISAIKAKQESTEKSLDEVKSDVKELLRRGK